MAFSRDYDRNWIAQDMRSEQVAPTKTLRPMVCPKCKRTSLHIGPMGLYCEEGDCEWEQGDETGGEGA